MFKVHNFLPSYQSFSDLLSLSIAFETSEKSSFQLANLLTEQPAIALM